MISAAVLVLHAGHVTEAVSFPDSSGLGALLFARHTHTQQNRIAAKTPKVCAVAAPVSRTRLVLDRAWTSPEVVQLYSGTHIAVDIIPELA